MNGRPKLNVQDFPRPPKLQKSDRKLKILWGDTVVIDTKEGYEVLETHHPITFYLPPSALNTAEISIERISNARSMCEWKGAAAYFALTKKATQETVEAKAWSYPSPTPGFVDIKDYLSFYASEVPWRCLVDGEEVNPQDGTFYGGWVTSDITGDIKGRPGTQWW